MKKITALLLALMMLAGILAGCGKPKDTGKAGKLKVVTTIFPEYDWVRAILGDKVDNAEITLGDSTQIEVNGDGAIGLMATAQSGFEGSKINTYCLQNRFAP